jgi:hypothetical protein
MSADEPTRGERNHNPGDIERGVIVWLGQLPDSQATDERFCQFDTPLHGIRALCRVLVNYQRLDGARTLAQMVQRFAPPPENDTAAYLGKLCATLGLAPDAAPDLTDPVELARVARSFIVEEQGRCIYDDYVISRAAAMAVYR